MGTFPTRILPWLGSNARPAGVQVDTVIVHATAGGSAMSSYQWLLGLWRNGRSGDDASYHVIIERDGALLKCVPLSRRAWHAGACRMGIGRADTNVNDYSVGAAFANDNVGERITNQQVARLIRWIGEVKAQYPGLRYWSTHAGCAYPRKTDPVNLTDGQIEVISEATGLEYVRGLRP